LPIITYITNKLKKKALKINTTSNVEESFSLLKIELSTVEKLFEECRKKKQEEERLQSIKKKSKIMTWF